MFMDKKTQWEEKKVFLKYISLSPGQIPLYPPLLEHENFQLLAKHFLPKESMG